MDNLVSVLVGLLQLALLVGVFLLIRRVRRPAVWRDIPPAARLQRDVDGALIVPVRRLQNVTFLSRSRNDFSSALWITDGGLRVKVFRTVDRPFTDFARVDAGKTTFGGGVTLAFQGHGINEAVIATLADMATARAVLQALPPGLALTAPAIALRDGKSGSA